MQCLAAALDVSGVEYERDLLPLGVAPWYSAVQHFVRSLLTSRMVHLLIFGITFMLKYFSSQVVTLVLSTVLFFLSLVAITSPFSAADGRAQQRANNTDLLGSGLFRARSLLPQPQQLTLPLDLGALLH